MPIDWGTLGRRILRNARPNIAIEELPLLTTVDRDPHAPSARHTDEVCVLHKVCDYGEDDQLIGIAYRLAWREHVRNPADRRSWEEVAFWRYVGLRKFVCLPGDEREVPYIMDLMRSLHCELYRADVPLIHLTCGAFTPRQLGVLQIYGSAGEAWNRTDAVCLAHHCMDTLGNLLRTFFPNAELNMLDKEHVDMVMDQIQNRSELAICKGYPVPRSVENSTSHEYGKDLMRALSMRQANFLFAVSAAAVSPRRLLAGQMGTNRLASSHASRQYGTINTDMSLRMSFEVEGQSSGLDSAFKFGRSWNYEDDSAIRCTQPLRQVGSIIEKATLEGGFVTSVVLLTDEAHITAAINAAQKAWRSTTVPIPTEVYHLTQQDPWITNRIRNLTQALLPAVEMQDLTRDPSGSGLMGRNSTVLTSRQLATYTSPSFFGLGGLRRTRQPPPVKDYYRSMTGDVLLGHFISSKDGQLTKAEVRLNRKQHRHTVVLGDSEFGGRVMMERLAYETTLKWQMQTIVFDFGVRWRKLLNAPELEGRVAVYQLAKDGPRRVRWNPLQVGRRINPEAHWRGFCEVFASTSGIDTTHQISQLRTVLYGVYVRAGVLVDDPLVKERDQHSLNLFGGKTVETEEDAHRYGIAVGDSVPYVNTRWWKLDCQAEVDAAATAWQEWLAAGHMPTTDEEEVMAYIAVDFPIAALPHNARQAVGRHRSRRVGLQELMHAVRQRIDHPGIDTDLQGDLQDITSRLETLEQRQNIGMFAAGNDVPDICEIMPGGWGICILEGGTNMDEISKAFLLGWAGWQIYQDCIAVRVEAKDTKSPDLQLIFDEANNFFRNEAEAKSWQSEPWELMWRNSRKHDIYLHAIAQAPSKLPEGIVSSLDNLAITQLKNRRDQDIVTTHMHLSSRNSQGEEWSRYLSSIPIGEMLFKLCDTDQWWHMDPMCMQPAALDLPKLSDAELTNLASQLTDYAP